MQFYRDSNGTFHPTQALAKATKLTFKGIDVPTDKPGLCEFLNLMNPPPEYLPQIRDIMSRPPEPEGAADLWAHLPPKDEPPVVGIDPAQEGADETVETTYREGQPTFRFMGSRDPQAIFTCKHCGKPNHNIAKKG